ncbi:EscU/YscU/HrcU family type III secretion system export apparatus switch protein [Spongiibacter sp. KMU-158]|uniref:Flagellar biosynthetic protein FlhB n=2 Tax=Spongiibacter pelagi TaxID=2760804 RepID=A0A927C0F7_9GAMM|nr:EscU/YscU/HrcU family type III secretion system export apparatus switch protein [Spongiibacter pelagi]
MNDQTGSNKPGEIAVSLHYDQRNAPIVSAKGEGDLAHRILELAMEHDVPIYQDTHLVQLLSQVDLDTEIPPQLYLAVAEIIAFAYRLKDRLPGDRI